MKVSRPPLSGRLEPTADQQGEPIGSLFTNPYIRRYRTRDAIHLVQGPFHRYSLTSFSSLPPRRTHTSSCKSLGGANSGSADYSSHSRLPSEHQGGAEVDTGWKLTLVWKAARVEASGEPTVRDRQSIPTRVGYRPPKKRTISFFGFPPQRAKTLLSGETRTTGGHPQRPGASASEPCEYTVR